MTGTRAAFLICMSLFALLISACGGDGASAPPPSEGQATVSADGGTINGPDGVVLSIPAGAVADTTTFRIARDAQGAPTLNGMTLVSPTYAVTPHGATFATAALLKLPYDTAKIPAGATAVVLHGEPDGTWHVSPLRNDGQGHALVDVGGLSWFSVGYCTPGDAGSFGFGIGDCPGNHTLTLEYMDGNNVPIPAPRNGDQTTGWVLPYPLEINQPTTLPLRVTWDRPATVNRADTVALTVDRSLATLKAGEFSEVTSAPGSYQRQTQLYVDPTQLPGAGAANGSVVKATATAEYCWTGFIIGRGPDQTVCWHFDTELRFRVHDTSAQPSAPQLEQAPANVDAVAGEDAVFTASFRVPTDFSSAQWQRWNGSQWFAATGLSAPAATQTDTIAPTDHALRNTTLTLKAVDLARDNGMRLRLQYCADKASGNANCLISGEVALGVLPARIAPSFTLQPADGTVLEGSTFSVTATATGRPGPSLTVLRNGVAQKTCAAPGGGVFVTACTFTTGQLALADSGAKFCFVASNDSAHQFDATSFCATVTVIPSASAPVISQGPSDQTVAVGSTAVFTATVTGAAPLSYQWTYNGSALSDRAASGAASGIAGSHTPQLTLANVQTSDAGVYALTVSNGTPPDATASATLTVSNAAAGLWNVTTLIPENLALLATDGPFATARLGQIGRATISPTGTVYLIDSSMKLRVIDLAASMVSTMNGPDFSQSYFPGPMAADASGRIYLTQDLNQMYRPGGAPQWAGSILRIDPSTGQVVTWIDASRGLAPADAIAIAPDGTVYVAEAACPNPTNGASPLAKTRISKISANGASVTALAGHCAGFSDGPVNTNADQFANITALAVDGGGTLWVVDGNNFALRKITPAGEISTVINWAAGAQAPVDGDSASAALASMSNLIAVGNQLFFLDGSTARWLRRYDVATDRFDTLADLLPVINSLSTAGNTALVGTTTPAGSVKVLLGLGTEFLQVTPP